MLMLMLMTSPFVVEGARRNTLVLQRSADDGRISSLLDPSNITEAEGNGGQCVFDGGEIVLSHPMDLHPDDKFFTICNLFQKGYELTVDEINAAPRCGLSVGGRRRGLVLRSYGEDGSKFKARAIAESVVNSTDFFLAPYTSGISGQVSEVAHDANKIMIAPGSYFTWVYEDKPGSFGVLPLPELYMRQVIPMLFDAGARTIQTVYEGGPGKQCESLEPLANAIGMTIQGMHKMEGSPTIEDFLPIVRTMAEPDQNPDVVITCTYDAACDQWIKALREVDWSPKAQVFSICVGLESFSDAVGTDAEHLIGMSPWDRSLEIRDAITGWTPEDYVGLFEAYTGRNAAYHAALGQATVSLLAQAIESADSMDYEPVSEALQNGAFETVFGTVSFDANGQNKMDLIATQYDANGTVNVVYPPNLAGADLVYPMPTWAERDCVHLSPCNNGLAYSGTCRPDGTCGCANENEVSYGKGPTAACHAIPVEDMTYINPSLKVMGYVFVGLQVTASIFFVSWTYYYRERTVVRISQPIFLVFVAFGSALMSLSILPLAQEGGYRYEQDPLTREETDVPVPGLELLDASCMAFPWLLAIGFSITFSALFAKILRVRKLMANAEKFRRKKVAVKDVLFVMATVLLGETAVLLAWQFVAPLRWSRVVIATSDLGYPTQSVGRCAADDPSTSLAFVIGLFAINFACVLTAIVLCYMTRQVKSDLNEAKYVSASVITIFQVLLLVVPIAIIASENTSAAFFVKSAATFIIAGAVTMFIFVPKLVNYHLRKRAINVSELLGGSRVSSLAQYGSQVPSSNSIQPPNSNRNGYSKFGLTGLRTSTVRNDYSGKDESKISAEFSLSGRSGSFKPAVTTTTTTLSSSSSFGDFVVELLRFRAEKGHCDVPVLGGDGGDDSLAAWVREIRREYRKLEPIRTKVPGSSSKPAAGVEATPEPPPPPPDVVMGGGRGGVYFAGAYGRSKRTENGDTIHYENAVVVPEPYQLDCHDGSDDGGGKGRFDRVRILTDLGFDWKNEDEEDEGSSEDEKKKRDVDPLPPASFSCADEPSEEIVFVPAGKEEEEDAVMTAFPPPPAATGE